MHVDIVSAFDDLHALKDNWNEVYAADPEGNYFLSWHWIAKWLERRASWFVLAARRQEGDERYVAFLPIQLHVEFEEGQGLVNILRLGGTPYAGYNGLLTRPEDVEAALSAFAGCLQTFNWKHLDLDDVYISEERLKALLEAFPASEFSKRKVARRPHITSVGENIDHDVYVYVPLGDDFETFVDERFGSKTRRNARKALRDLVAPQNELRITHVTPETMERDLALFYEMWNLQWGERQPRYGKFILDNSRHMLPACIEHGTVFMPILWHQDKPVGTFIIFLDPYRKSMMCFLGSRDLTFRHSISPGFMLHCYNLRWAIENGYRIYDMGTGNYSYKDLLGSEHHIVEKLQISTLTGRNIGDRLDPHSLGIAMHQAVHFFRNGNPTAAELCCRQILAVDEKHAQASSLLAKIEAAQRPRLTGDPETHFSAAAERHRAGDLIAAEAGYRDVILVMPDHFDALQHLALLLLQKGDLRGAAVCVDKAIEAKPTSASAYCNRGNIQARLSNFDQALASYDRAIALDAGHAIALNNRGNVLRRLGRHDDALESYDRAIAIEPGYAQAAKNREAALQEMAAVPA
ncbi:GNAT family N-acetyltransferase [Rhizobium sp. 1399]|jgi:CelD/BcsL family acetyltransferase involved in cellulose biosynthesis/predicted negative regulator of RcsB-dependent stress response|uniref:GNAT family N-acetyltransferase n=1 Tax=Rhizobium sp. 1399 TaxID=2817758 RepID=UPI002859FC8A|nr:GNAT family N-acetyltransferase [Rhizobium sp. 1399]MDR6666961.1 CelD/BcsL family acetyltransferase involved in cellulose biosynthesis/Tfp pilus assembly protein PilF [Rhizobium sp. 1399]